MNKKTLPPQSITDQLDFISTEAYNAIRTNLNLSFHGKKCNVIGFTSAMPHEGKSFTVLNTAFSLAKGGKKVLLIGGDLRKPSLEQKFGMAHQKGLSNVLCGELDVWEAIQRGVKQETLDFLSSGDVPPNPAELLSSQEMSDLIRNVSEEYDYILIDLPPIVSVSDAITLKDSLDGMVVIVRHRFSQKRFVRKAMNQLNYAGIRVIGFIYNCNTERRTGKYYQKKIRLL